MKHEIHLENYTLHTDLALETIEQEKKGYQLEERVEKDCKVTKVIVEEETFGKKKGTYITIEFEDITDHTNQEKVEQVFMKELKNLMHTLEIKQDAKGLVIGLGNAKSTPDSLGPLTLSHVLVTRHLFLYGEVEEGYRSISTFLPGVTGETGMETSELVESVIQSFQPDFVVVIDALASRSIERVGHTIQITDTGIQPGSGIGNKRKEISSDLFHIPVLAIGVPTVVDAATIVSDTIGYLYKHVSYTKEIMKKPSSKFIPSGSVNYLKKEIKEEPKEKEKWLGLLGTLTEEETKQLIYEVLTPIGYNLMVTPKEVDFLIENLSFVLGNGLNHAFHKKGKESFF